MKTIGRISRLYRYPVKSMAGEEVTSGALGWYGLEGDRRLAFLRRRLPGGGVPWLTASKLPALVTYRPERSDGQEPGALPTHVRTPGGTLLPLRSEALREELEENHGAPLELVQIDHGIFDDAPLSIINRQTMDAICSAAERPTDVRRFRPNVVLDSGAAFSEGDWIGKTIEVGQGPDAAAVLISMHDIRCVMINLDPDTADADANMLKAAVRLNENRGGVYASVVRPGRISIGDQLRVRGD